ncbi:hypothetical protein, partial [Aeromonas sobria]|uniref:hypothetical protein n=1 Tax=Aeromonas sobria TaxID=646 RepID=UPI003D00AA04
TVMTVEIVKNDLTFEVGRVFLLSHRNEEPLLVGCPTFGVHFIRAAFSWHGERLGALGRRMTKRRHGRLFVRVA